MFQLWLGPSKYNQSITSVKNFIFWRYYLTYFQVQSLIGYCPQFDALIDQMTSRETLHMYGRLRGVKEEQLKMVSQELIDMLLLTPYADKKVVTYRYNYILYAVL